MFRRTEAWTLRNSIHEATEESCKYNPEYSVANDAGFMDIPKLQKALLKAVATVGPISVAIDAGHESFQFYKEGIYFEPECSSEDMDHGVLVLGYGFERTGSDNSKYWLVKNSWSEEWGINGYINMAKDRKKTLCNCLSSQLPHCMS
ncbi:hypothetical protein P7K49_040549 [Saguinus oedipus]|uniref:Peptidase C1A papain C-terminal domain-containing protein n=1 Tax=Saguinus oedipus TaxID=9490 RepID=A0ABQ9TCW4_SAGOE|nr:hypothetical protein P7K49_040544 [Saguinus oedipus]KAK2082602.1 hypothetical protein P7K49_040549 [Saguinus oedipus]